MEFKRQMTIISALTIAELKSRYRNTFAGLIWVMVNPLIMFSVHGLIFKYILKINVDKYYVFLLSGLLPWIFISSLLGQAVNIFITKREALLSYQIHPFSLIISKSIDAFINFIIPFVFLGLLLLTEESYHLYGLLFLPILMFLMYLGALSLTITISILQVFFRDIQYILQFVLSIMFFLTPIFYPRYMIPDRFQFLVDLNPFYAYIRGFKAALWEFNLQEIFISIGHASIFILISTLISLSAWKRFRNELYLNI